MKIDRIRLSKMMRLSLGFNHVENMVAAEASLDDKDDVGASFCQLNDDLKPTLSDIMGGDAEVIEALIQTTKNKKW